MMKRWQWWICFSIATFVLSQVFENSRALTSGAPNANGFLLVIWLVALIATFMLLAVDAYVKDKQQGKIPKPNALMEFLSRMAVKGFEPNARH